MFLKIGFILFDNSLHYVADRSEMSPSSLATLALDDTHGLTSHKNTYGTRFMLENSISCTFDI